VILPYNGKLPRIAASAFLVDNCDVIGDVVIGEYSSVWFGAVVRGDIHYIRIGDRTNIQDLCMVHVTIDTAPTVIGSNVTIGHGAILHGCTIEDHCLIGMGAKILDGAVIGSNSMIAAGAVIRPGFQAPSGVLVAGVPAEIKRELRPEDIEEIRLSAERYVDYSATYIAGGYEGQRLPDTIAGNSQRGNV
jgi:carbonic anhydrase/acetyltransferase-like protein (isoleucine patch superfamily)